MEAKHLEINLPEGWIGSIVWRQTPSGRFAGTAELRLHGQQWGTVIFMNLLTLEAVLARVKLRASQFISERLPSVRIDSEMMPA